MKKQSRSNPSSLETHLGFWLRFVSNHVSGRFRMLLETHGCSVTEWVALRILFDRRETTHAELIHALGMTKGAASKVISRLEERNLTRRQVAAGARGQFLVLTRKGTELVPRLAALADENEDHFFHHLGERERQALMKTFQALVVHHRLRPLPVN